MTVTASTRKQQGHPFTIEVSQETLDDLSRRLANTRWTSQAEGAGWELGTDIDYLKSLVAYWLDGFDWRAQEATLNQFAHFRADVEGFGIHFIHERGTGPNPLPIMLLHGWPDSFYGMHKIIPMLADPESHGGDIADSFDVVVPSLPGYGFSDLPPRKGFTAGHMAQLLASLMTEKLGYARFAAHGGDVGSVVAEMLAREHAPSLVGIHLTEVPYWHVFAKPEGELSEAEQRYLEAGKAFQVQEGAYSRLQATKPQSLAQGLNDSPSGLAAWFIEKFRTWSDCGGDIERRFTRDELLTNIMLYWVTGTIGSSFLTYYQTERKPPRGAEVRTEVPTSVAILPQDLVPAPREFGERFFNIQRWTEMSRGGHFAALEEPELLVDDIRAAFRPLRERG